MNKLIKLYWILPIFLQNIAISWYGLYLKKIRYSGNYRFYLENLKSRDFSSKEKEKEYQNKEFIKLLHYSISHSNFYRELYKCVDIDNIKSVDDISLLPVLTKEMIRNNINNIITINPKNGYWTTTGGTTGKSLRVLKTKDSSKWRMARLDYFRSCFGFVNLEMNAARFTGQKIIPPHQSHKNKIFWRSIPCMKQRLYSSLFLTPENIPYYIENLNKFKPAVIESYVSCAYEIAKYINDNNITLTFLPKAIFTTSETVLDIHRTEISKAFKCEVIDQYASQEGAPFITQCKKGKYHENIDTGVFEHIHENGVVKLLVTSFDSYATPLIRYDIGDTIVESENQECECGMAHPIIKAIGGREVDYLLSSDGKKINQADLSEVIYSIPRSVVNIQFIQKSLDTIDVYIVFDKTIYESKHETILLNELHDRFGKKTNFTFHKVKSIEREKNGKYRLIKRMI